MKALKKNGDVDFTLIEGAENIRPPKPDILKVMSTIRARVRETLECPDQAPEFEHFRGGQQERDRKAGEIVHSEDLRYLNQHHAHSLRKPNLDAIESHRPLIGRFIVKLKRKVISLLWDSLLKDYFHAEKEFNSRLVRLLNDFSKYADSRDASNFWELVRKIDYDVNKAVERIDRAHDEQVAALRSSERRVFDSLNETANELNRYITDLKASEAAQMAKVDTLEAVTRGLE
ncbi:MAG: hypothetical protein KDD53_12160, partial [Bdellovibrionales bacterium]|nr:hypothetical protein [Bdellovibrionales bacterium]